MAGTDRDKADAGRVGLDMQVFFPYRLAVLAEAVSRTMAAVYADRFDLTRQEWRVLVALSNLARATATEVAEYSTLDKMQVSRAVAEMERKGLIARAEGRADRRTKLLTLTGAGRRLFEAIVPLVLERQRHLIDALEEGERAQLGAIITKLTERARALTDDQAASGS